MGHEQDTLGAIIHRTQFCSFKMVFSYNYQNLTTGVNARGVIIHGILEFKGGLVLDLGTELEFSKCKKKDETEKH